MIYRVVLDDTMDLHTSDINCMLLNPSLDLEMNSAGSFNFTLPPSHPYWDAIKVLKSTIDVYEDGDLIFTGRIASIEKNWNNERVVQCEGALAYFNDSVHRQMKWETPLPIASEDPTVHNFLKDILDNHNVFEGAENANRHIFIGNITVDPEVVTREVNYDTTLDILTRMCIDTNGGYMSVRKDLNDGKLYLDWIKDFTEESGQPAQFGLNLLNFDTSLAAEDICTGVLARGAEVNEQTVMLNDVELVDETTYPDMSVTHYTTQYQDILWHREGVAKFGQVVQVHDFSDAQTAWKDGQGQIVANSLFEMAKKWLEEKNTKIETIEVEVAELAWLGEGMPKYKLGQIVELSDNVHMAGESYETRLLPMYKLSCDLNSGSKKVTLGTPPKKELTQISASNSDSSTLSSSGSSSGGGGSGEGEECRVHDVKVNGTSVVTDKIANVTVPTDTVTQSQMTQAINTAVSPKANTADVNQALALKQNNLVFNSQDAATAHLTKIKNGNDVYDIPTGTEVEANPTGAATSDLTKLKVGSDIYGIPSGGTSVEANPSDPATDDLNTIKIGNTVYDIPGGGGGGSYTAGSHIDISNNEISVRLHDDSPLTPSEFDYTGTVQTYVVPYDAIYKLQVWGASGGDGTNGRSHAGYGGYTEGKITLTAGDVLYIYVGQAGVGGTSGGDSTRFNGGGKANHAGSWSRGSGGGATHIAKVSGLLSTLDQNINDILIVAGGGGGAGYYAGNEYGTGGSGGGYIGGNGVMRTSGTAGTGATQQAGGTGAETGSFGKGADKSDSSGYGGSGGGGGFYGGGSSSNTSGAGGGSGYYNPNLTDACMYGYEVSESSGSSNKTVSVNEYDTDPVPQVAKSGNGYAIITCLGTTGTDLITREDMKEAIEEAEFNNLTMMSDYYSEEERMIGRWIDGKPLYQITLSGLHMPNNDGIDVDVSYLNIDKIAFSYGNMTVNGYTIILPQGNDRYVEEIASYNFQTNNTILRLISRYRDKSSYIATITFQYTKTTDAPGTGPTKGNLIYLPALYSEEEREVGVWTDGKPLYQKTIAKDLTLTSSWQNYYDITGIDLVNVEIDKLIKDDEPIPLAFSNNGVGSWIKRDGYLKFCVQGSQASEGWVLKAVTLRYTKTTDQPGSATWTPEGQLAHHYSTSEKIVGTWIDGSTVYERTWDFGSNANVPSGNYYTGFNINSSSMDKILSGKIMNNDGTSYDNASYDPTRDNHTLVGIRPDNNCNVRYLTLQYTKTS